MRKLIFILFLSLFSICTNGQSGYNITVNLKNCTDSIAYLTFYQFDKTYIKDSCINIKNGRKKIIKKLSRKRRCLYVRRIG